MWNHSLSLTFPAISRKEIAINTGSIVFLFFPKTENGFQLYQKPVHSKRNKKCIKSPFLHKKKDPSLKPQWPSCHTACATIQEKKNKEAWSRMAAVLICGFWSPGLQDWRAKAAKAWWQQFSSHWKLLMPGSSCTFSKCLLPTPWCGYAFLSERISCLSLHHSRKFHASITKTLERQGDVSNKRELWGTLGQCEGREYLGVQNVKRKPQGQGKPPNNSVDQD